MNRYFLAGAGFGCVRKSLDIYLNAPEITVERRLAERAGKLVYVSRNRPMLTTEKIAVVAIHACICALYSPYFIICDLNRAEARMRGIDLYPAKHNDDDDHNLLLHAVK